MTGARPIDARWPTALAAVVVLALGGCSSTDSDNERGSAREGSPSVPGEDYTVPPITDPLDPSTYRGAAANACVLLTEEQVGELDLAPGESTADDACRFGEGDGSVVVAVRTTGGLDDFYRTFSATGEGSWEPLEIAGRPAAHAIGDAQATYAQCIVLVGLDDDALLRVEDGRLGSETPDCARVDEAATLALDTLSATG